jgi:enoyl-CoA hydratase/carnithine racemase
VSDDAVLLDVDDGVATITLNRPERRNALSAEISDGIQDAVDEIEGGDARCVVITGAGGAFCAGGDVDRMREGFETDPPAHERAAALERSTSELILRLTGLPVPTVAKIDGPAVGAGANLAIACDVQVASASSVFGFVFRQVGLSVDAGTSYLLPRLVGENVAKELVFTGELFDAERAADLGVINHAYPDDEFEERADELVGRIADGPTVALGQAKKLLGSGLEKSLGQALRDEANAQGLVFGSRDHREGVEAFLADREPEFEGR